MITIEVTFFGGQGLFTRQIPSHVVRELPRVTLPEPATIDDLFCLLRIPTGHGRPLVSVNRFYQRDNVPLRDGDRVLLLRTVVGGAR